MKKMILTLSALFVIGFSGICEEKEDIVQKKYKGRINIERTRHQKAMGKIYKSMLKDYDALLKRYIKSNKLEEATEIKEKIKNLTSVLETGIETKKKSAKKGNWIIGKWEYRWQGGTLFKVFDKKTCKIYQNKTMLKMAEYKITGGKTIIVEFPNGPQEHKQISEDKCDVGKYVMTRVKD